MIFRNSGIVRRSAGGMVGRCCCPEDGQGYDCINDSGVVGVTTRDAFEAKYGEVWLQPSFLTGTCIRALVWKSLTWVDGDYLFDEWRTTITPDWILRIAEHCSGTGHPRKNWSRPSRSEAYPILSRCWDYNPCTGLGDFDFGMFEDGAETLANFLKQSTKDRLNEFVSRAVNPVTRFSVGIEIETFWNATLNHPEESGGGDYTLNYWDGFVWELSIIPLTPAEILMVDGAQLEDTGC